MAAGGGEAAHPVAAVALRKALLEFCAARPRMAFFHGPLEDVERIAPPGYLERLRADFDPKGQEQRALREMQRWLSLDLAGMRALLSPRVCAWTRGVNFADLPSADEAEMSDRAALLQALTTRLAAEGLDVLVADFSGRTAEGVHAVKVIVPGLEVETMSYGRIGERNARRLSESGTGLAGVGAAPAGATPMLAHARGRGAPGRPRLGGPRRHRADRRRAVPAVPRAGAARRPLADR